VAEVRPAGGATAQPAADGARPPAPAETVLAVKGLTVSYPAEGGRLLAVDGVHLALRRGEVLGVVGESGSGKTTMATAMLGLVRPPARVDAGEILLEGRDLRSLAREQLRRLRWTELAFIPQGAMSALNPVLRVSGQFTDVMRAHGVRRRAEIAGRTAELLAAVGLEPAVARRYPHELSGGMKQRVCIAMAIALGPKIVVADEPTSALDVVVQRSVMETLKAVQAQRGLSLVLIGHDMALQAQVVDRIAVMCRGHLVELGATAAVFRAPAHPYTRLLLGSVPSLGQSSWVPAAASPELREEAYRLAAVRCPLRPAGPDHEVALS
jgi:peptide/nickel transport system ATP-binding protein